MTNVFCPLVTNNIELTTQGEMTPCCISSKRFCVDGQKANAYNNSITEVINSSDRREWIDNFQQHFQTDCKQCYEVELSGGESKRIREINLWRDNLGFKPNTLQSIDLKMGNTCNLACAICGSHSSSKWGSIDKQFGIAYTPAQRWQDTDEFWEELNLHADNLKRVELAGGEPFMIKKQIKLIQYLVEHDLAKDIDITWITNCTFWPEKIVSYFKEFKMVRIMLSLDNTGKQFEYIRYPAKWDDTYEIFLKFKELQKQGIINLGISHSVGFLNAYWLPEFHAWAREHEVGVYNNLILHPIGARELPKSFKDVLWDKFSKTTDSSFQNNPIVGTDNWFVKYFMEDGDREQTYDYIRNILIPSRPDLDFYESFPELRGHINV